MNPQYERFNEQLEQVIRSTTNEARDGTDLASRANVTDDAEGQLLNLAQRLQVAPQLRVDPSFAAALEQRILRHAPPSRQRASWLVQRRYRPLLLAASVLCLFLTLTVLLVLLMTTRTTSPASSPYPIKQGGQPAQLQSPTSTPDQAMLDLQAARIRLHALAGLANPAHNNDYLQALASFDKQLTTATRTINALSPGTHRTQLLLQLSQLKSDARQQLRAWLPILTNAEGVATTAELGNLGAQIPRLSSAIFILPVHPGGNATVRIIGSGIQPGARLLINGNLYPVTGTPQNGQIVFVLYWKSEQHPHSLGISNPDGTVAQTENITVQKTSRDGNGKGNGK